MRLRTCFLLQHRIHSCLLYTSIDDEFAARLFHRPAATAFIRLPQGHFQAFNADYIEIAVAQNPHWIVEQFENDTFLLGMMDFLSTGRQLLFTAAVYNIHPVSYTHLTCVVSLSLTPKASSSAVTKPTTAAQNFRDVNFCPQLIFFIRFRFLSRQTVLP